MPDSMDFDVTASPRALEDALTLATDKRYTIWNTDTTATVRLRTAAAEPVPGANAVKLSPGGVVDLQPEGGVLTWAWSFDPDGASLLIETNP